MKMTEKFDLFTSWDCGISYQKELENKTLDELHPRLAELDKNMLRWYLERDGELEHEVLCGIYKEILRIFKPAQLAERQKDGKEKSENLATTDNTQEG